MTWWKEVRGFPSAPMLASPTTATKSRAAVDPYSLEGRYSFDVKLDGVRAIMVIEQKRCAIINRNGVDITARYPELPVGLGNTSPIVLDGEIVSMDGSFETLAFRDRQSNPRKITEMTVTHPVQFIAFDVLSGLGYDLRSEKWKERRRLLDGLTLPESISRTVVSESAGLLDLVSDLGMEGVIAKRHESTYTSGRSREWLKFKALHRVSCVPTGYEPGNGQRAHFGAMHLAMIGPDGPVDVGRVGTGFDDDTITYLKKRLDNGDLFVVEIETLNRTKTGVLRFPVFKGVRSDLEPKDCTVDQLETLPTC